MCLSLRPRWRILPVMKFKNKLQVEVAIICAEADLEQVSVRGEDGKGY